jgi:hypothetical protein
MSSFADADYYTCDLESDGLGCTDPDEAIVLPWVQEHAAGHQG